MTHSSESRSDVAPTSATSESADASSSQPGEFPFFHDFSCRQRELDVLLAHLRNFFSPEKLTDEDRTLLTEGEESELTGSLPDLRSLLFIGGRSGMGKTRLLQEAMRAARASDVHVKEIFCYERQGIPFLPVLRLVKDLLVESRHRQKLWDRYAPILSRVYPELAGELGEAPAQPAVLDDSGKVQLFDALTGILLGLGREKPLLLALHDLHRSDRGTIEFLEYLGRNVFLEVSASRSEGPNLLEGPSDQVQDGGGAWKEIRQRQEPWGFLTEGFADDVDAPHGGPPRCPRVMVVANYLATVPDPAEAPPPDEESSTPEQEVEAALAGLRTEPFARLLALPPLDAEEMGQLLRRTLRNDSLEPASVERIHEATGGNPLYALEICRVAFNEGTERKAGNGSPSTPLDPKWLAALLEEPEDGGATLEAESREERLARRLVLQRVASLEPNQLRTLRLLATVRRPLPVSWLVDVLGTPRNQVEESLKELHGRDLVSVLPVERAPRFLLAHDDYNRFIYRALDPEERTELHGLVGHALAQQQPTVEPVRSFEIYDHLKDSATPREAFVFGRSAAQYFAGGFALELAVQIENHLLGLLDAPEDQAQRLELLAELTALELRMGRLDQAKAHAKELIEASSSLEPDRRLAAYTLLSEAYQRKGEPLKGIKTLNRAAKACSEALDEAAQGRIAALRARLRLDRQDAKRAINLCMRGLKTIESIENTDAEQIMLLETLADAHLERAETGAALPHYQRLLELTENVGDETKQAAVLSRLGRVYYDRGNYFRSARFLFKALDVIRRLGDIRGLSRAYDALGKVYRNSGDNIRGIEYFNRSLRIRERIGDLEGLSPTLNSLGSLYAHSGDYFRAVRCFQRSVRNSERFGDTSGLVRAFLHLGWIYFQVGELRQVESLAKQILILSQEFGLLELEGEGHRLQGNLLFLRGDWRRAEREYRRAVEIASKRSSRRGEAAAKLDLGDLLSEKEDFEPALKLISRAQLLAEEIRSIPLRARANLLKGNVHRFLKGGNLERAKESFHKGIELLSGENPLPLLWELQYSLAKLCQGNLEFDEAGENYERAEKILERIAAGLPQDMKIAYGDDRRRKVFFEDYRRFQKESAGRSLSGPELLSAAPREEKARTEPAPEAPQGVVDAEVSDGLVEAIARVSVAQTPDEWLRAVLGEARRLVPSPAGALLREVETDELSALATREMGAEAEWLGVDRLPGALCRHVLTRGKAFRSGDDATSDIGEFPGGKTYRNRSVLAVPVELPDRFRAVLYLQRPSAGNPFLAQDEELLARFLKAIRGQFATIEALARLRQHGGTPLLSLAGLQERLDAMLALPTEESKRLALFEAHVPGVERLLGDDPSASSAASQISQLAEGWGGLPPAYVGSDHVAFILALEAGQELEVAGEEIHAGLKQLVEGHEEPARGDVEVRATEMNPAEHEPREVVDQLQARLSRHVSEFHVDSEIDRLTSGELTLKEAKSTLERRYITAQLLKTGGNITRAAESLGVHRPQLSNLIKKYNVRREDFE